MSIEKVLELKSQRTDKLERARQIVDSSEGRSMAKSEVVEFDGLMGEVNKLRDEINSTIRREGLEAEFAADRDPILPDPGGGYQPTARLDMTDRSYRGLFHAGDKGKQLDMGDFKDMDEFFRAVTSARGDLRLKEARAHIEGDDSLGGFSVPEEFAAWLLDMALEAEVVRGRATVWPMERDRRKVPAWANTDHSSSLFGGLSGTWIAEGGTATRQTAKMRQLELIAKKLAIYSQASRELLEDGLDFGKQLGRAMSEAMAWYLDYAFLQGSGVGEPLGVLNSPSLIAVAKEGAQAADTIEWLNIVAMESRLHPACFKKSVWVANQDTMPQLKSLYMTMSTLGAADKAVTQDLNGNYRLDGKELLVTEKLPTLGDQGDIMLVDFSKYTIGMRKEMVFDRSVAPGWTEDLTDYRTIVRCDGQDSWGSAITPKVGSSISWVVALAERT